MAVVKKTLVIVLVAAILSSISPCYEAGQNSCAGTGCSQLDATPCVDPIKNDADHCTTATCALRCLATRHRTRSAYCKHEGSKYECCCPP
ncbi:hypothetical protein SORBI_3005G146200 [Sorghum bicolor]|uniref:Uncharacterized protein n=1 Tax=Sorghum bicolor TaxID=4558 RepID=A0A1B6PSJ9_SORBI|nr:hypothetical protein SORBI_3005G146200 [Sorghum bicolor]